MRKLKPRFCAVCGREIDPNPCGNIGALLAFRCPGEGLAYIGADYGQVGLPEPDSCLALRLSGIASNQAMFMPIGGAMIG